MSDESEIGGEIDPYRLEAMRLAMQWTERRALREAWELIECAAAVEAYLRTGATS